jgi:hypothetical protein
LYKAELDKIKEDNPTDKGKKLNCRKYISKKNINKQIEKSERETPFAGKRRPTHPMVKGRRALKPSVTSSCDLAICSGPE